MPTQQYGVLRGRVKAVGRTAADPPADQRLPGSSQLGEQFSQHGQPVAVLVQLDAAPHSKSGYAWSTSDGPPYDVDSMTPASGAVHLAAQHPIDWLLP